MGVLHYRSIFISDVHLGTRHCRANYLLDFLASTECEQLYLVGDIIDLWAMRRAIYWTAEHTAVVQAILDKARAGTRVIYIPGNHDEWLREFVGSCFHGVEIEPNATHTTADGRRFFVSHGDEFDALLRHEGLLHLVGDSAYGLLLAVNRWYNRLRRRLGRPYWSLSAYLKTRVGRAAEYMRRFERAAARETRRREADGYICGHIHKAGIERLDGVVYCNDGDWVEHCTGLVEDFDGSLHLLHWADHKRVEAVSAGQDVVPAGLPLLVPQPRGP